MVSLIVPCFNEEAAIAETISHLIRTMEETNSPFEIICINDGSTDQTLSIIESVCNIDKRVKCISFSRNFGHQPAISAGIINCSGEIAIIIDADLQDPPELIPLMIQKWEEEKCNVVYAVRKKRHRETFFKKITAGLYYRILKTLSEVPMPLDTGDFRLIDKKVISAFRQLPEKQKYIRGLISWIGFKQVPIYYERAERVAGETKFSLRKMLRFAQVGLIYFTRKPLRLAIQLGIFSFFVGILLVIYVLISKYYFPETTVKGWSSILIAIIFFGGVQLLTIGLLGEYISSIFDEVKSRPEFITDRMINF